MAGADLTVIRRIILQAWLNFFLYKKRGGGGGGKKGAISGTGLDSRPVRHTVWTASGPQAPIHQIAQATVLAKGPIIIWNGLIGHSWVIVAAVATLTSSGLRIPLLLIPGLASTRVARGGGC